MSPVPALSEATGWTRHQPVTQDWGTNEPFADQDQDPSINAGSGGFVSESGNDLKDILKISKGPNQLQTGSTPS